MKKHQLVGADIIAHEDRIKDMNEQADSLMASGQFEADGKRKLGNGVDSLGKVIQDMAAHRRALLNEANWLDESDFDFFVKVSWIKEKKLLVTSDDYGRDLTGVQNLRKKHKRFESELGSHEPAIQQVQDAGAQLIAGGGLGGPEIEQRLQQLNDVWSELKFMAASRGKELEESITYQQFLAKIEEEEAWISEKQQLLTVPDLGDNMAAVQGLLKKHDAFETDISVHGERCTDICEQGQMLIEERNHHADNIAQRCEQPRT